MLSTSEAPAPQSRLYNLSPYALGTGLCEGLVSYIERLARAHCVSPRKLVKQVFAEVDPGITHLHSNSFYVSYVGTANGLGSYASRLSRDTCCLTGRTDLHLLTLLPWTGVIPPNGEGLLNPRPRWCVQCFIEQMEEYGETYFPLAWSLQLYTHCPKHDCCLQDRCPHCHCHQDHLPKVPDGIYCCHCGGSLLVAGSGRVASCSCHDVEHAIESAVARSADLTALPIHDNLIDSVRDLIQRETCGNCAAFCRIMGWDAWAVNAWVKKGHMISFPKLLQLAVYFDLNPVDFCTGVPLQATVRRKEQSTKIPALIGRSHKPQLNSKQREAVLERLTTIAQGHTLPSPLRLTATSCGLTRGGLKYWFPDQCAELSEKRKRMRATQNAIARAQRHDIVFHAVADLITQGRFPSRRGVDATIREHGLALARPELLRIYRLALEAGMSLISEEVVDQGGRYTALTLNRGSGMVRRQTRLSAKLRAK